MARYQGIDLEENDYQAMCELEKMVNEPIPIVTTFEWNTFGFAAENKRIVGIGLFGKQLFTLPQKIWGLSMLRSLMLVGNGFGKLADKFGYLKKTNEIMVER